MAIEFNCPHCNMFYRLPDELAGKRANCKKQDCRKVITIPQKSTIPPSAGSRLPADGSPTNGSAPRPPARGRDDTPPPDPVDVEAAAAAALNEVAKDEVAPVAQSIPMKCGYCDHQWTEPREKAGKNVLCPNPECRQRIKVPDLKKDEFKEDWRTGRSNKPSLAKENFEKPKDVQDAADVKIVTQKSMKEAGAIDEEVEPRPMSQKVMFALLGLGLVASVVFGVIYLVSSSKESSQDKFMEMALEDYEKGDDRPPPPEAALFGAVLQMAAAEYDLRHNDEKSLQPAIDKLTRARSELVKAAAGDANKANTAERHAVACELAVLTVALGGSDAQQGNGIRIRWTPGPPVNQKWQSSQKTYTVQQELQKTFDLMRGAEFDLRAALARRLTRDLARQAQEGLAADLPMLLFTTPEQAEARAVVALELLRADRNSARARQMAEQLKADLQKGGNHDPQPASAYTLWQSLTPPVADHPSVVGPLPPPGQGVTDQVRLAHAGLLAFQGKTDEAVSVAQRPGGTPAGRLRALLVVAEWSPDPVAALGAAVATVSAKKQDAGLPQFTILRLTQIAGAAGKPDQAEALAGALTDEGLKVWAKADAFRSGLKADSKDRAEPTAVEVPDDPKKLRAGHAWARLWLARHNARVSGDGDREKKEAAAWQAGNVRPFGYAGIALGLQDRAQ
jgi:hypothetical protein